MFHKNHRLIVSCEELITERKVAFSHEIFGGKKFLTRANLKGLMVRVSWKDRWGDMGTWTALTVPTGNHFSGLETRAAMVASRTTLHGRKRRLDDRHFAGHYWEGDAGIPNRFVQIQIRVASKSRARGKRSRKRCNSCQKYFY